MRGRLGRERRRMGQRRRTSPGQASREQTANKSRRGAAHLSFRGFGPEFLSQLPDRSRNVINGPLRSALSVQALNQALERRGVGLPRQCLTHLPRGSW